MRVISIVGTDTGDVFVGKAAEMTEEDFDKAATELNNLFKPEVELHSFLVESDSSSTVIPASKIAYITLEKIGGDST